MSYGPAVEASVVIPAHNEATVILRTLRALLDGIPPGLLQVVVSCNGCTDDTAAVVRASGLPVTVIETSEASKIVALRAAEEVAVAFPRIYLDADVVLSGQSVLRTAEALRRGPALAGRPVFAYDTTGSTFLVRRYYAIRSRVPELTSALWGAGVYAVSAEGHERITPWPEVLADDLHVDRQFGPAEIVIVDAAPALVKVPRTSEDLVKVLARTYRGKRDAVAESAANGGQTFGRTLAGIARIAAKRPWQLPDALIYLGFAGFGRVRRARGRRQPVWERDESTRVA